MTHIVYMSHVLYSTSIFSPYIFPFLWHQYRVIQSQQISPSCFREIFILQWICCSSLYTVIDAVTVTFAGHSNIILFRNLMRSGTWDYNSEVETDNASLCFKTNLWKCLTRDMVMSFLSWKYLPLSSGVIQNSPIKKAEHRVNINSWFK